VLRELLDGSSLVIPDAALVREAVERYAAGRGDFADHLIRLRAEAQGASPLGTLDEALHRLRGFAKV
jgi:predicted nucleic-acid-binding protein